MQVNAMKERVQTLLARVAIGRGGFCVIEKAPEVILLQHWQVLPCTKQPLAGELCQVRNGRKFYLSPHMTDAEILQTALLAVVTFEEHEVRERFRFDGQPLFSPHKSMAALSDCREEHR